jgi:hypothetical protein
VHVLAIALTLEQAPPDAHVHIKLTGCCELRPRKPISPHTINP